MLKAQQWLERQEKYSTEEKRSKIKELNISEKNLEGELDLSDFKNLSKLNCCGNKLTKLDISKNANLDWLLCYNNKLVSLDTSNNQKLVYLNCWNNQLRTKRD